MRGDRRSPARADKKAPARGHKRSPGAGASPSKNSALLEEAITHMNAGRYGRSSSVLKELLTLDPANPEAKRLFATLQLRLGSLVTARNAFEALTSEALERQDYWLAESLLREYLVAGPRCVPFVEKLGAVFELKGDLDAAIEEYAKAVEILVEDPDSEQPDLAAQLVAKIAQLSPRNPVLLHLESLLQRVKDRPRESVRAEEDGSPPRFAPAMSGLDQPVTDVEFRIPPAGAISDPGRARLPWEDEAEDILVPQQLTSTQDTGLPTSSWHVAGSPPQDEEVEAPQIPQDSEVVRADVSWSPDMLVPPASENAAAESEARVVQEVRKDWSALSTPDSKPFADQGVPVIANEGFPPAGVSEDTGSSFEQSKDGSEQPDVQLEGLRELEDIGEESSVQSTMGHVDGLNDKECSSVGRQASSPTGSGLAATEESPSVEIPSRSENSESDRPTAAVPPPMPWEQVEEIRPASMPVETESRLIVEEVNEDLIAGILQQTDLREKLAGGLTRTTIQEVPDPPLASEPALLPELDPALDCTPLVSTSTKADAETALFTQAAESSPVVASLEEISAASESRDAVPAFEPVAESSPSIASSDDMLEQPVETMTPGEIAIQSSWTNIAIRLAVPQDTDSDPTPPARIEAPQVVEPQDLCLREEGFPHSSWPLAESEETREAGTSLHLSQQENVIPVDDPIVSEVREALANSPALAIQATPLVGESIVESQIESESQPVRDQEAGSAGHSEPTTVEAANPPTFDGEGTAGPVDFDERNVTLSGHVSSQPGASEYGQSVGLSERLSEVPPIVEERGFEPSVSPQDRLATPFDSGARCEEFPVAQSWHEPLSFRSESEEPASSSILPDATAEGIVHCDEPLPAGSPPVVGVSMSVAATVELAMDSTPDPKASREQTSESRKPISTVGLHESTVQTTSRFPITASLSRFFFQVALFTRSCFATANAVVVTLISLVIFSLGCAILLVGGLGLAWVSLEQKPNRAFQDLMGVRPQPTEDPNRNGALYLLGFDAPESKNPIQAGLAIQNERTDLRSVNGCLTLDDPAASQTGNAATSTLARWYREDIPSANFKGKVVMLKEGLTGGALPMARYQKWLTLPFDDVGYGQAATPDCRLILDVHRLFVAEGFAQGLDQGIERIETEAAVWRGVLRKARTLETKLLAVAAVRDGARVVSGLLTMPELDARYLSRLGKVVSPLDGVEQSLRWPMQHEFLLEKKRIEMALRTDHQSVRPWYMAGVALMPLPNQRILNTYADYYEDLIKSVETARTMPTMPSPYAYVRTPAERMLDYLMNPVNNLLEVPPGPAWKQPIGQVRETDALLRLASLQAWIRRGAADVDVRTRVAKAGQDFYDPFTGYPMLINQANNRLYSVGTNGKDDDAAAEKDVSVRIPSVGTSPSLNPGPMPTTSSK